MVKVKEKNGTLVGKVKIRFHKVSDAKRLFEILQWTKKILRSPIIVKDVQEEINCLKKKIQDTKDKKEFNFTILYNGEIVGSASLDPYGVDGDSWELGYLVDENQWNKGIATKTVKLLEAYAKKEFKIKKLIAITHPKNIASQKVLKKNGFEKIKLLKKYKLVNGKLEDRLLYSKILH